MTALLDQRRAGALLHPTSLPSGSLGADARAFVDWLQRAKMSLWQVLPLSMTGAGSSPYSSLSALAMNPLLIDVGQSPPPDLDFDRAIAWKWPLLLQAARDTSKNAAFIAREPWVKDVALFLALKNAHGQKPWWEWPVPLRDRDPRALADAEREYQARIDEQIALQALCDEQWHALRDYARARGVSLIGDMPIYVDRDSADVWKNRDQFQLDPNGQPLAVSGVPPDYFSETGQLWGNPLYDWDRQARDGHHFWIERLSRALRLTDVVRIDHFRGFSAYWAVPAGAKDARSGSWRGGPGRALFDDLRRELGPLPIIAEDLGSLDEAVHALRRTVGLPGMYVLQFAFGGDASNPYLPHNHQRAAVVYTGTHDNDTTRGYWDSAPDHVRDHLRRYLAVDGRDIVWDMIRATLASPAATAIIPVQDLLELGSDARMNRPSLADGNWRWRLLPGQCTDAVADRVAAQISLYGRHAA